MWTVVEGVENVLLMWQEVQGGMPFDEQLMEGCSKVVYAVGELKRE